MTFRSAPVSFMSICLAQLIFTESYEHSSWWKIFLTNTLPLVLPRHINYSSSSSMSYHRRSSPNTCLRVCLCVNLTCLLKVLQRSDMSVDGQSGRRWRRYVHTNMTSAHLQTRRMVREAVCCMLLEEHIIVQYSWLQENTMFPGTLEVTEDRQYRERGLIHISDACFECLKRIEEQRQQLMNETRLQQSVTGRTSLWMMR